MAIEVEGNYAVGLIIYIIKIKYKINANSGA